MTLFCKSKSLATQACIQIALKCISNLKCLIMRRFPEAQAVRPYFGPHLSTTRAQCFMTDRQRSRAFDKIIYDLGKERAWPGIKFDMDWF